MDSSPLSSLSEPNAESPPAPSSPAAQEGSNIVAASQEEDEEEEGQDKAIMARRPVRKAGKAKKVVVRRPAVKKSRWTAENIVTDPKSPLATADLRVSVHSFSLSLFFLTQTMWRCGDFHSS